ncbi:fibronectin type III domain-containing protein [Longitalea luteola]|uniref:fibronectin type III domain-containing protein n=1 Tax=Longitalea luteola TaxID=2812563 RepID=UPI001A95AB33|nr:fibronectin type III domain-containing protein [Longitalea luteola]
MSVRISTKYRTSSDPKLLKHGYQVSDTMKDNPIYANSPLLQSVLQAACDDFRLAGSMAGRKDRALLSAKNDKKAVLIGHLDVLNDYLTATCKGDKTLLLQSGFEIAGLKNESQELPPIREIVVGSDSPGIVTIRLKRVTGARSYVFQYTTDPLLSDSVWVSETSLNREHTFSNLNSVTRYWFRVYAIGKGNQTVYSPPVARVIQ